MGEISLNDIKGSIIGLCELLLDVDAVSNDADMQQKLRAAKNYADTFFDGNDAMAIKRALGARPALQTAIEQRNIDAACAAVGESKTTDEAVLYALGSVGRVRGSIDDDTLDRIWAELDILVEYARQE